ncbi:hypothetical protein BDV93DRAFT_460091 [Ceratobasidium sp. AG-I]|nr:hypothetical protein BDV93DRAFT_460366 [Ceratobasidium sp. AG-I]KAF8593870.1 hypothetical protein BDV93DRAFT_460091 [Ceratobasidium sp. AG-I]
MSETPPAAEERASGSTGQARTTTHPGVVPNTIQWTPELRAQFVVDLVRAVVSSGMSFNCVNDYAFRELLEKWIPGVIIPDRRTIGGAALREEVLKAEGKIREVVQGKPVTGICDGWRNVSKTSLVACMITADFKSYLSRVVDVTADRKTSDNLLEIVEATIDHAEHELGVRVIAWCTDAGGDERGMRRRLSEKRPHIITLDCYAHQVSLCIARSHR